MPSAHLLEKLFSIGPRPTRMILVDLPGSRDEDPYTPMYERMPVLVPFIRPPIAKVCHKKLSFTRRSF